ncbi:MAG: glycoside hydrolase family 43 protein [Opitutales bacterium]
MITASHSHDIPLDNDGPDPFAMTWNGATYVMVTRQDHLELMKLAGPIADPASWAGARRRDLWFPGEDPRCRVDIWAPEIHALDGHWWIYFAGNSEERIDADRRQFVLRGPSADSDPIEGAWSHAGPLRLPEERYAIDGTVLPAPDGRNYFIWSSKRQVADGWYQHLMISPMLSPTALADEEVVISAPTAEWERHDHPVNEGPQLMIQGNDIWLGFSASAFWTPHYAVGFLHARLDADLMDPASWTKHPEPFFQQIPALNIYGPGHASFVRDLSAPDPAHRDAWRMLYHARATPEVSIDAPRRPHVRPVGWTSDVVPMLQS